ncbi:MAG: hypothetical protein KDD11_02655 [Acidobacteria bacterium]|nr:hypothetical protein [Acidobacteriota bacterium]
MRMTLGTVAADGTIVIGGEPLPAGSRVTVLAPEVDDDAFRLTASEETELEAAIRDCEAGEALSGDELLARLRKDR